VSADRIYNTDDNFDPTHIPKNDRRGGVKKRRLLASFLASLVTDDQKTGTIRIGMSHPAGWVARELQGADGHGRRHRPPGAPLHHPGV